MTYRELFTALINDEVQIDTNGHDPFYGWGKEHFINFTIKNEIKFWEDSENSINYGDREVIPNKSIYSLNRDKQCSRCDAPVEWEYNPETNKLVCTVDVSGHERDRCQDEFRPANSFDFVVKDIVSFANYFTAHSKLAEASEESLPYNYYNLSSYRGRVRLTEFFAGISCGYQQTCNTSIQIYMNQAADELLLIEHSCVYDDATEREYEAENELPNLGYKYLGRVSCGVWRYMFLNKCEISEEDKEITTVEANLKPGVYKVDNIFDSAESRDHKIGRYKIASRIKMK